MTLQDRLKQAKTQQASAAQTAEVERWYQQWSSAMLAEPAKTQWTLRIVGIRPADDVFALVKAKFNADGFDIEPNFGRSGGSVTITAR